jgi:exonuclease SbcD
MRILHTSDWHLGRTFGGQSMHQHHEAYLAWLIDVVREEGVSLVVVAGDVYDRSIPGADTVALFGEALRALRAAGAEVVVIAGNHDSPERLSAYDDLTDLAGVYVRGGYGRAGQVLHLGAVDGPLDVVAVPYLEPALAPGDELDPRGGSPRPTHRAVLEQAVDAARSALRAPRSIIVAHAFVAGASSSESERTLHVGGGGLVPTTVFDGFSYAALGHLHKPQTLSPTVRYSGSPLPYSFSEQHAKQVLIVDLAPDGGVDVRPITVDVGRRVATVRGTIDEVLHDPRHTAVEHSWVRAVLTDPTYVVDAKSRLLRRFPHVVEIVLEPVRIADRASAAAGVPGTRRSPLHNAVEFWHATSGAAPTAEVVRMLGDAIQSVLAASPDLGTGTAGDAGDLSAEIPSGVSVQVPAEGSGAIEQPSAAADAAGRAAERRTPRPSAPTLFDTDALWDAS